MAKAAADDLRPTLAVVAGSAADPPPAADAVAVRVLQRDGTAQPGPDAVALGGSLGVDAAAFLEREKARGEAGEVLTLPLPDPTRKRPRSVLLVGIGDGSPGALRKAG